MIDEEAFRKKVLLWALGSKRAVQEFTEEGFLPYLEADKKALSAALGFNSTRSLYIHGPVGCGKSHIAAIAIRQVIKRGTAARTILAQDMIRESWSTSSQSEKSRMIQEIAVYPVLCIDDLGTGRWTEDGIAVISELIHKRWLAHMGGLIVTSNLSLDQLAALFGDDRITSRLYHLCEIISWSVDAPDRRMVQP